MALSRIDYEEIARIFRETGRGEDGEGYRVEASGRYGYTGLDVYRGTDCISGPIVTGTKREMVSLKIEINSLLWKTRRDLGEKVIAYLKSDNPRFNENRFRDAADL